MVVLGQRLSFENPRALKGRRGKYRSQERFQVFGWRLGERVPQQLSVAPPPLIARILNNAEHQQQPEEDRGDLHDGEILGPAGDKAERDIGHTRSRDRPEKLPERGGSTAAHRRDPGHKEHEYQQRQPAGADLDDACSGQKVRRGDGQGEKKADKECADRIVLSGGDAAATARQQQYADHDQGPDQEAPQHNRKLRPQFGRPQERPKSDNHRPRHNRKLQPSRSMPPQHSLGDHQREQRNECRQGFLQSYQPRIVQPPLHGAHADQRHEQAQKRSKPYAERGRLAPAHLAEQVGARADKREDVERDADRAGRHRIIFRMKARTSAPFTADTGQGSGLSTLRSCGLKKYPR